jgi:WD40 repeat protein
VFIKLEHFSAQSGSHCALKSAGLMNAGLVNSFAEWGVTMTMYLEMLNALIAVKAVTGTVNNGGTKVYGLSDLLVVAIALRECEERKRAATKNFVIIVCFMDGFRKLHNGRELSKPHVERYISAMENSQLRKSDLSATSIVCTPRSVTNCLALDRHEDRYLLGGTLAGGITLFDLQQSYWDKRRAVTPLLEHVDQATSTVASLQWYPEDTGAFVAASMRGEVAIFDTNQFVKVATFQFSGNVIYAARMRPGVQPLIAVALQDGSVRMCDPRTRDSTHVLKGHSRAVTRVEWSTYPGESYALASAGMDGAVRVWDVRRAGGLAEAVIHSFDWRGDFRGAARVETSKLHTSLLKGGPTRDGTTMAGNSRGTNNSAVVITDSQRQYQFGRRPTAAGDTGVGTSGTEGQAARAHDAAITALHYTSCGRFIVTAGNDRQLRLWRAATAELIPASYGTKLVPMAQLPFDLCIAESSFASEDVLIAPAAAFATVECPCNVQALNAHPGGAGNTGAAPIVTKEGDIVLFPVHSSDSQPTRILRGHLDRVTSIVYRRSQQQLISAARDGMVFVWEAPKAKPERSKENKSRHNELYYGTAAGRYDFANVAQRVLGSVTVSTAAEEGAGQGVEGASAVRRLLPLQESAGNIVVQGAGPSEHDKLRQDNDNSGDSSGDNWSDDEVLPTVVSNYRGRGGGDKGAAGSGDTGRRGSKAARTIASASAGAEGTPGSSSAGANATASAPTADNRGGKGTAGGTVVADRSTSSTTSSSRFVPPIIQQYLREAGRSAPVVTDLSGSGTEVPAVTQRTAHSNSNSGAQATRNNNSSEPVRSWDNVDGIFEAPSSTSNSVGLGGFLPPSNVFGDYSGVGGGIIRTGNVGSIIGSVSSGAEPPVSGSALGRADGVSGAAGGTRAAPALPLQPNERYKAWLKQARAKNNTKKK